jgi:hypothetical protein
VVLSGAKLDMKPSRALATVILTALAVRIAFAVLYLQHPVGAIVPLDTEPYRELARAVADGTLDHPAFDYLNPPYAFLLAPIVGASPAIERAAVAAVQIAIDVASVALVYYIALTALSRGPAFVASLTYALYGTAIFYTATVLPVTLSVFALVLAVAAVLFATDRPPSRWVFPGAALGFLALVRPNAILLVPIVIVWRLAVALRREPRPRAIAQTSRRAVWLMVGLIVMLAPFSLRARHVHGRLSPFPMNGGINFYIGNNPQASGRYAHVDGVADRPGEQVATAVAEASRRAGRALSPAEASGQWFREGLAWIAHAPGAALGLTLKKAAMFFRAEEATLNISYDFARAHIPLLRGMLGFGVLMPVALWGAVSGLIAGSDRRRAYLVLLCGVVLAYAASVIAFFISDRYRMPVVPLLAVLAAHGAFSLLDELRAGRASMPLAVVAIATVGVNYHFDALRFEDDGTDHVKLSDVYCARGEYDLALAECEKARALAPAAPDTLFCFANAYYFKKDPFRAEMALRATLESQAGTYSDLPAQKNLVWLYREQRLFDDALRETTDAAQRARITAEREEFQVRIRDLRAYAAEQLDSGRRHHAGGRLAEARYDLKRAVSSDPALDEAYYALARVSAELRLPEEACEAARRAHALQPKPEHAEAEAVLCH